MAWSTNYTKKCCATCANWSGPRSVNSLRDKVTIEGSSVPNAKCYIDRNVGGFAYGPKGDWCCSKYQKWAALK